MNTQKTQRARHSLLAECAFDSHIYSDLHWQVGRRERLSASVRTSPIWRLCRQSFRDTGTEVEIFEPGNSSRREQGVDQCLQVHMLRAALDVQPPGVAVLLTGDGAGFDGGTGFHADLALAFTGLGSRSVVVDTLMRTIPTILGRVSWGFCAD